MVEQPDPAAVFSSAMSLHDACVERARSDPSVDISESYNGGDEFLRQMMRVGNLFEEWACEHIAFEELEDVWPYLLEDRFGAACLVVMEAGSFGMFDREDCLRVAYELRLPMRVEGSLPLPVCIEAANLLAGAIFSRLRIQTIREELGADGEVAPFVEDDDPYDENYGQPFFGIYGVRQDGSLEHIADRATYQEARDLMANMLPGIEFPQEAIAFARSIMPRCGF
jgi:hypothetical protein